MFNLKEHFPSPDWRDADGIFLPANLLHFHSDDSLTHNQRVNWFLELCRMLAAALVEPVPFIPKAQVWTKLLNGALRHFQFLAVPGCGVRENG